MHNIKKLLPFLFATIAWPSWKLHSHRCLSNKNHSETFKFHLNQKARAKALEIKSSKDETCKHSCSYRCEICLQKFDCPKSLDDHKKWNHGIKISKYGPKPISDTLVASSIYTYSKPLLKF